VGDDDDRALAGLVLVGCEEAAEVGGDAEEVEEVGAEVDGVDLEGGLVGLGQREGVVGEQADGGEGGEGGADIEGVAGGDGALLGLGVVR